MKKNKKVLKKIFGKGNYVRTIKKMSSVTHLYNIYRKGAYVGVGELKLYYQKGKIIPFTFSGFEKITNI